MGSGVGHRYPFSLMSPAPHITRYRRRAALLLVPLGFLIACEEAGPTEQEGRQPTETHYTDSRAGASPLAPVIPVAPVLRATIPDDKVDAAEAIAVEVRATPGIAAVARAAIAHVTTESAAGRAGISILGVDPLEFRPLAPAVTSQAEFVWRGLISGDLFLAHEEHERLGVRPGSTIYLKTPPPAGGFLARRVGGVAANGSPNLAGAMLSLQQASALGVNKTNLLVAGIAEGQSIDSVLRSLHNSHPSIPFQKAPWLLQRSFITGPAAARAFGSFNYVQNEDGTIAPDPGWVRRNIVRRRVPILGDVVCHRLLIPQLVGALTEIEKKGAASSIDAADYQSQGGCYVPRLIRGEDPTRPVSMHAWGLAIDINVNENQAGLPSRQDPRVVEAFERWGFRWGGRWTPPDAHHFELAALIRG